MYDVAYLAGGPRRVVRTALIELRERGAIKFIGHRVKALRAAEPTDHPVERVLIKGCHPVGKESHDVAVDVLISPEMEKIERRLVSYGLLSRSWQLVTDAGERELEAAKQRQEEALPAYVFDGLAAVPDERLRTAVRKAMPVPAGLGRSLIRMGNALDDDHDHDHDSASDSASDWGSHSDGGHASCGSGCGGGGGGGD
ncbi:MAG: TIGR04222 domain-containing membrane protein [Streptomyces sp.]|nr:TIGR04222 domain-containing membrane protein [Streptomyces sp.]